MAFVQYLTIESVAFPLPDSYEVELTDVEAESGGETEAGTTQRDIVRSGVVRIAVSFTLSSKWLGIMSVFRKESKLKVQYFDTETLTLKSTEMYMDGYKAKLLKDSWEKGIWSVNFHLKEF